MNLPIFWALRNHSHHMFFSFPDTDQTLPRHHHKTWLSFVLYFLLCRCPHTFLGKLKCFFLYKKIFSANFFFLYKKFLSRVRGITDFGSRACLCRLPLTWRFSYPCEPIKFNVFCVLKSGTPKTESQTGPLGRPNVAICPRSDRPKRGF